MTNIPLLHQPDPSQDLARAKAALRSEYRKRRKLLAEREVLSALICERVKALPEVGAAGTVHVYWPMVNRAEVDLRPLIRWLADRGTRIAMPVLDPEDPSPMTSRLFTGEDALTTNSLGVSEPLQGPRVPRETLDLVIVPALVAGRDGSRLGYGKGHYDAFLRELGAPKVCAIYAECVVPHLSVEPHDVPVDVVVTENEVIRTGAV